MSAPDNTGGQAFPIAGFEGDSTIFTPVRGMTLRDYFAAKALSSLIVNPQTCSPLAPLSLRAYEIADAMLAARKAQA